MFDVPTREQQYVLDWVAGVFLEHFKWPSWAWLEEKLERKNLSGLAVYSSFVHESRVGYGPVWPYRVTAPNPDGQIGLTLAGLMHVSAADSLVRAVLKLIANMGMYRNNVELDPFDNERPRAHRDDLMKGILAFTPHAPYLAILLGKEPATWHCQFEPSVHDWQEVSLSPEIRRFAGVEEVSDYLERLVGILGYGEHSEEPIFHSPFSLPAAADYLDSVWQLRFGSPLVVPPGVERSARLAFAATTPEEADTRLSALAELLKGLNVPGTPGVGGHPLVRMGPFLEARLPPESHDRVKEAIALLDAARQIRAATQHSSARRESIECLALLGIHYPVYDWPAAWQRVQVVAAHAFDSIRDEIQASQ